MVLKPRAEEVNIASTYVLCKLMTFILELVFELRKVLHDGGAVTDVARPHAIPFSRILRSLSIFDDAPRLINSDIAAEAAQLSITLVEMNTHFESSIVIG